MTPEQAVERIRRLRQSYDRTFLGLVGLERYCDFAVEHDLPLPDDWVTRLSGLSCDLIEVLAALSTLALDHAREKESEGRSEDHSQPTG